jgi:hypothetical protein
MGRMPPYLDAPYWQQFECHAYAPIRLRVEGVEIAGHGYPTEDINGNAKYYVCFTYEAIPEELRERIIAQFRDQHVPIGAYAQAMVPLSDVVWIGERIEPLMIEQDF